MKNTLNDDDDVNVVFLYHFLFQKKKKKMMKNSFDCFWIGKTVFINLNWWQLQVTFQNNLQKMNYVFQNMIFILIAAHDLITSMASQA